MFQYCAVRAVMFQFSIIVLAMSAGVVLSHAQF